MLVVVNDWPQLCRANGPTLFINNRAKREHKNIPILLCIACEDEFDQTLSLSLSALYLSQKACLPASLLALYCVYYIVQSRDTHWWAVESESATRASSMCCRLPHPTAWRWVAIVHFANDRGHGPADRTTGGANCWLFEASEIGGIA